MSIGGMEHSDPSPSSWGHHITTISHEGRFWDVYLDFEDDPRHPDTFRGFLKFSAADAPEDDTPLGTATIIIENSFEEAVRTAQSFGDRQLAGFLRSVLP
ncbi:MAG: hypothetical protein ACOC8K_09745 [Gemmatimonadota bacterium]